MDPTTEVPNLGDDAPRLIAQVIATDFAELLTAPETVQFPGLALSGPKWCP